MVAGRATQDRPRAPAPAEPSDPDCIGGIPIAELNYGTVPEFVLQVPRAYVIKVYDGDTITVVFEMDGRAYRKLVRLSGIDTPERTSKDPEERARAETARQWVADCVLHRWVDLSHIGTDKYGRVLARVHARGMCINDELLYRKMAVPYEGGTKGVAPKPKRTRPSQV